MDLAPITPETRPQTEQEVFDYVVRFLRRQKEPAMLGGACRYRLPDGRKCAAGCLILDAEYSEEFEGDVLSEVAVSTVRDRYFQEHYGFARQLVRELQNTHDNEENPNMWEHRWAKTAHDFGLTMPLERSQP